MLKTCAKKACHLYIGSAEPRKLQRPIVKAKTCEMRNQSADQVGLIREAMYGIRKVELTPKVVERLCKDSIVVKETDVKRRYVDI